MLQSMTGFGKATSTFANKKITVEIKSLNSKNLDLFVRMPSVYRQNEIGLRKVLEKALDRGKVECNINVEVIGTGSTQQLNATLIKSYYEQLSKIGGELNIGLENIMATLVKMPDPVPDSAKKLPELWSQEKIDILKKQLQNYYPGAGDNTPEWQKKTF